MLQTRCVVSEVFVVKWGYPVLTCPASTEVSAVKKTASDYHQDEYLFERPGEGKKFNSCIDSDKHNNDAADA